MTPEQQRAILEAAAKACKIEYWVVKFSPRSAPIEKIHTTRGGETVEWNPIDNSADTASMCAKLEIDTIWTDTAVLCADDSREREQEVRHDGTPEGKEAAWRLAASMLSAKIGGYSE